MLLTAEFEETSAAAPVSIPFVPTAVSFEVLSNQNHEIVEENGSDDLAALGENIREKIGISIKKKVQTNVAIDLISEEDSITLESKLIEDMDEVNIRGNETIQEQLKAWG